VTRSINPGVARPNQTITVTLNVDVKEGERYYIIEEIPSKDLEIQNPGELIKDPNDHLKMVVIEDAADTAHAYTVKAPEAEGSYSIYGIYIIEGMETNATISGQSTIVVSSSPPMDTNIPIIIAIVIIIIVIVLVFYIKK